MVDHPDAFVARLGTDGALRHRSQAGLLHIEGWPKLRAWRQCRGTPRRWLTVTPLLGLTPIEEPSLVVRQATSRREWLPFFWSPWSRADWDELEHMQTTKVVAESDEEADALLAILPQNTIVVVEPPGASPEEPWGPSPPTLEALRNFVGGFPAPVRRLAGQFQTTSQWDLCRFLADDVSRIELGRRCPASLFLEMLAWMRAPAPPVACTVLARIPAHQCCAQLFRWLGTLKGPAQETLKGQTTLGCSTALAAMVAQRRGRRLRTDHLRALDEMEQWRGPWKHPKMGIVLTQELTELIRQLH